MLPTAAYSSSRRGGVVCSPSASTLYYWKGIQKKKTSDEK